MSSRVPDQLYLYQYFITAVFSVDMRRKLSVSFENQRLYLASSPGHQVF